MCRLDGAGCLAAVTPYWVKVAVTMTLVAEALNEQKLVPGQAGAPVTLQPTNVLPGAGVGVSFTMTLRVKSKLAELQATPQLMPAGVETTVPWPLLFRLTVLTSRKVGVTVVLAFSANTQGLAAAPPVQIAPAQLTKRLPAFGAACRLTTVP